MTNEQLYIVIGVPILFNAIGFLLLSTLLGSRISALETRMNSFEARMSAIESRLTALETSFNIRFDLIMEKITELEKEINKR